MVMGLCKQYTYRTRATGRGHGDRVAVMRLEPRDELVDGLEVMRAEAISLWRHRHVLRGIRGVSGAHSYEHMNGEGIAAERHTRAPRVWGGRRAGRRGGTSRGSRMRGGGSTVSSMSSSPARVLTNDRSPTCFPGVCSIAIAALRWHIRSSA